MAMYLGSEKRQIVLNGVTYNLNVFSEAVIVNSAILLSLDGCILKDSRGLYLIPKEDK